MSNQLDIAMIAAVGPNLELGIQGDLVWHISADLKNFKRLTTGHPVIMGRKTWESLPKRPLPGRKNIVLSRSCNSIEGAVTAHSVEEALKACEGEAAPFIIGGAAVYGTFLPLATELYLTSVDAEAPKEVDAWFPEFRKDWEIEDCSEWQTDDKGTKYRFERWKRN